MFTGCMNYSSQIECIWYYVRLLKANSWFMNSLTKQKPVKLSQAVAISFIWVGFRFLESLVNQYPYKLQSQPLNNANAIGVQVWSHDSHHCQYNLL